MRRHLGSRRALLRADATTAGGRGWQPLAANHGCLLAHGAQTQPQPGKESVRRQYLAGPLLILLRVECSSLLRVQQRVSDVIVLCRHCPAM